MAFLFWSNEGESGDEMCFESDAKKRWKKKSIHYSRRTTTTTRATKEEEGFVRTFDFPKTQKKKKKKKTLVTELETVLRETKHERRLW